MKNIFKSVVLYFKNGTRAENFKKRLIEQLRVNEKLRTIDVDIKVGDIIYTTGDNPVRGKVLGKYTSKGGIVRTLVSIGSQAKPKFLTLDEYEFFKLKRKPRKKIQKKSDSKT